MNANIRPVTLRDLDAWISLRLQLWPEDGLMAIKKSLRLTLKSPRFRAWLAVEGGAPVAFAEAYVRDFANGCEETPVAFLEGIWVHPNWRRKGLSRKLVREVEKWARKKGLNELCSDALLRNTLSHRTHRKWGFKETERVVYFRKKI